MRARLILAAVCVAWLPLAHSAADQKKDDPNAVVQVLDLKGLMRKFPKSDVKKPLVIASAEELVKALPEKDVAERVAKQVDFSKQKLLFFAWSGAGNDKFDYRVEQAQGKTEVVFLYHAGGLDNLVGYFHLFAVPKDAMWKVADK